MSRIEPTSGDMLFEEDADHAIGRTRQLVLVLLIARYLLSIAAKKTANSDCVRSI